MLVGISGSALRYCRRRSPTSCQIARLFAWSISMGLRMTEPRCSGEHQPCPIGAGDRRLQRASQVLLKSQRGLLFREAVQIFFGTACNMGALKDWLARSALIKA